MSIEELILELEAIKKECRDILIYMYLSELVTKLEKKGITNETVRDSSTD